MTTQSSKQFEAPSETAVAAEVAENQVELLSSADAHVASTRRVAVRERASVAAMGLSPEEVRSLIESFGGMPGELHFVGSTAGLFKLFDGPNPPQALLLRPTAKVEPTVVIDVLRSRHPEMPVMVLCDTELEASYYNARADLAPISGLVGTLSEGGLLLCKLFIRARTDALDPVEPSGEVDEQGLARLLFAHRARRSTGELSLVRGTVQRSIFLLDGEAVWAESNLLDENFGRFLLRRGVINEVEYRWSQRLQNREGVQQGEALVKIGVFTEEVLHRLLQQQIRAKLLNAFDGGRNQYVFHNDRTWLWRENLHAFDLVEVVAEGLNRGVPTETLDARWAELRSQYLLMQVTPNSALLGGERRGGYSTRGGVEVRRVDELFGPTLSVRRRLSVIDALVLSRQAALSPSLPEGLVLESQRSSLQGSPSLEEALERITPIAQPEDVMAVLGISPKASLDEIDEAYMGLKRRYAPEAFDRSPGTRDVLRRLHARIELAYQMAYEGVGIGDLEQARVEKAAANREWRTNAVKAEEHYYAGRAHLESETYDEALAEFCQAQAVNPDEPLFLLYQGWTLTRTDRPGSERWERGKGLVARALEACPVLPNGYVLRARIALAEQDVDTASELLRRAVRLEPTQPEARTMLDGLGVNVASHGGASLHS